MMGVIIAGEEVLGAVDKLNSRPKIRSNIFDSLEEALLKEKFGKIPI